MKTLKIKPQTFCLLLLALGFMLTTGMKCKKDNNLDKDGLPKATQNGAMLFACKVNGENWVARRSIYNVGGKVIKDTLIVTAHMQDSHIETFAISLFNTEVKENVIYKLNDINNQYGLYGSDKDCFLNPGLYGYGEVKSMDGEVVFTKIDKSRTVVSGTFWFNISTDKCGDLKVTNGRFDINIGSAKFLLN